MLPRNQKQKNTLDTSAKVAIIVAVIGLVGTLGAPTITSFLNRNANATPSISTNPPVPTQVIQTTPTETPLPAVLPSPTEAEITATSLPVSDSYNEDFTQGSKWLPIETPTDEWGRHKDYLENGRYVWEVEAIQGAVFSQTATIKKFADFEFEVTFERVEYSDPTDYYGIKFRGTNKSEYYFFIKNNGQYNVSKYHYGVERNHWQDVVVWTSTPLLVTDGRNTLKVAAQGNSMQFFINGNLVERIIENNYGAGSFRLTSIMGPDETMKMEVSRFRVLPIFLPIPMDTWPTQRNDIQTAELQVSHVDDLMTVLINGQEVISANDGDEPYWLSILDNLKVGDNTIEITVKNGEGGDCDGDMRVRLNGILNTKYQSIFDGEESPANAVCFHDTIILPLK